jgi:LmbE family N-acetylglucosaminyl deacetylase
MLKGNGRLDEHDTRLGSTDSAILIIGAHPDDNVLGAGGFAAKMARNRRVVFVTATRGERGGDAAVRELEDQNAAGIIGVELRQWNLRDCKIHLPEAIEKVSTTIQHLQPQIVLVHGGEDSHQDHRILSEAARSACRQTGVLMYYEGPTTMNFKPQLELDISAYWDIKLSALQAYATEMSRGKFHFWAEDKARGNGWPRHKGGYVEAFEVGHADLEILGSVLFEPRIAYLETLVNT